MAPYARHLLLHVRLKGNDMPIIDGKMMEEVQLQLCTDCALVYGAGWTDAELGQDTYGAAGLSWDEYTTKVESWDIVGNMALTGHSANCGGCFTCSLCDGVEYGEGSAAVGWVVPG